MGSFLRHYGNFNPRSREGSDSQHRSACRYMQFQSTLPRGERPARGAIKGPGSIISIHAPARGATWSRIFGTAKIYFNPRSREGSDGWNYCRCGMWRKISIHAPARGATNRRFLLWQSTKISIHAPARGATEKPETIKVEAAEFQSTLPRGERQKGSLILRLPFISIHAPARGATVTDQTVNGNYYDFNPRSREGSDRQTTHPPWRQIFQSTLPRGERLQFYLKFTLCF